MLISLLIQILLMNMSLFFKMEDAVKLKIRRAFADNYFILKMNKITRKTMDNTMTFRK
jgi:hypothetical protein